MKKADIMLTFLFYTILGLVIFVPVVLWASQFLKLSNKSLESYQNLAELVKSVKDDEILSMPFYMDKKSIIVGFSKNSNRFEDYELYGRKNPEIVFIFNRPQSCESQKACICLCSDVDLQQKAEPYSAICNKGSKCTSLDKLDILPEKTFILPEKLIKKEDIGKPQYTWKGGFLYHISDNPAVAGGISQNQAGTRTFYIQKYKGIVDVCLSYPCMTDETKKRIDLNMQEPLV